MSNYEKMTKMELAELIVERRIAGGHYKPEIKNFAIRQHMKSDRPTLIWSAEGGEMRKI